MIKIFKGDATNVANRNLTLRLPDLEISEGYTLWLTFLGIETELGDVTGRILKWNYTAEQTSAMPLGIHFAVLRLKRDDLVQTVINTIPIEVSDCVSEVYDVEPTINASITLNCSIPPIRIQELTMANTTGDVKEAFNALLAILKIASGQNQL